LPKIAALAAGRSALRPVSRADSAGPENSPARASGVPVEIVVIGVSTGGPSALEAMLPKLPGNFRVPVMIVQHMPKLFTGALAQRLDRSCALRVREAYEGAELRAGTIWLAPGDAHMEAEAAIGSTRGARVRLHQQRSLNHCKPSVDYLFSSAARLYGAGTLAVVMTGMGADGLAGARRVYEAGGAVLTQDAATSAVWGMPGRVFAAGLSREPLPLHALAQELTLRVQAGRVSTSASSLRLNAVAARPQELEVIHGML
jgi:two-component system chemotaxis response regulator CheB